VDIIGGKSAYYDFIEKGQRYVGRIGVVSPTIAKEIIARKRAEVIQGRFGIKSSREGVSFMRFVTEKYLPIFQNRHRMSTVQATTRRCREFVAVWSDRRIQDISIEAIERWKNQKLETCKPSSCIVATFFYAMKSCAVNTRKDSSSRPSLPVATRHTSTVLLWYQWRAGQK
jgi:hypothetical protein